jgi:hypothetical protein
MDRAEPVMTLTPSCGLRDKVINAADAADDAAKTFTHSSVFKKNHRG